MYPKAETISNDVVGLESTQLLITFARYEHISDVFRPSLENVHFEAHENRMMISLKSHDLREPFRNWVRRVDEDLGKCASTSEFVNTLNYAIKSLVLLGKRSAPISITSIRGLYGELHVLHELLFRDHANQASVLEGWHRPSPSARDFSLEYRDIEVKTITRSSQTIPISSEYQLEVELDRLLEVRVITIDHFAESGIDSLGLLYEKIFDCLDVGMRRKFEVKCIEDAFFPYPGPQHMPLTYKLNVIEDMSFNAGKQGFPKIEKSHLPEGISGVTYKIDVSRLSDYKL